MRPLLLALLLPLPALAEDHLAQFDRLLTLAPGVADDRAAFEARLLAVFPELTLRPFPPEKEPDDWRTGAFGQRDGVPFGVICTRYGLQTVESFRAPCGVPQLCNFSGGLQDRLPGEAVRILTCQVAWEGEGLPLPDLEAVRARLDADYDLSEMPPYPPDWAPAESLGLEGDNGPHLGHVWIKAASFHIFYPTGKDGPAPFATQSFSFTAFEMPVTN